MEHIARTDSEDLVIGHKQTHTVEHLQTHTVEHLQTHTVEHLADTAQKVAAGYQQLVFVAGLLFMTGVDGGQQGNRNPNSRRQSTSLNPPHLNAPYSPTVSCSTPLEPRPLEPRPLEPGYILLQGSRSRVRLR